MSTSAVIDLNATGRRRSNPFPGLRPFREDEEYLFFGRESQVDAMVNRLATTRFLAVVGTSGSGKSSLVNCGLRPALHGGLMARAGTAWRMAQFRPGTDPSRAMAGALATDGVLFHDYPASSVTLPEIVDTNLRTSKLGLIEVCKQAQLGEDVNLLVVVDQFEELFRYRQLQADEQDNVDFVSEAATAFVNLLLEAKEQTTYPIYVVLTMRSDFLGECSQFPGLAEAINEGQYLVPRMTRAELRAAISGPVSVGGAEIAPVLLTRLVNDVGGNTDQLSILQHALRRTWACWKKEGGGDGPLDLAHYEAIGTMAHALDHHAEKAYAELKTAREQQICEKIFKALTDKATDPRGVRRPTPLGTLCALADATAAEVTAVIDVFRKPSRSFLMPPAGEALEAETVIDISHESLMRVWQRLSTWADEEARSAETYRRLADTAALHAVGKASLWRDPDLQLALDWRDQSRPNETWASRYRPGYPVAMGFLAQAARRAFRNKVIGIVVVLVALVVAFAGFALVAYNEQQAVHARQQAVQQKYRALSSLFQGLVLRMGRAGHAGSLCFPGKNPRCTSGRAIDGVPRSHGHPDVILLGTLAKSVPFCGASGVPHRFGCPYLVHSESRTPVSRDFVVASEFGQGRVIGYAHHGVIGDKSFRQVSRREVDDNLTFVDSALRWTMRSANRCHERRTVRLYQGDRSGRERMSDTTEIARLLKTRRWRYRPLIPHSDLRPQLKCTDALIWGNPVNVSNRQLRDIVSYVNAGGGLLLGGLGWAWRVDRTTLATYPANRLAAVFGFAFSSDAFTADAGLQVEMPVGVGK